MKINTSQLPYLLAIASTGSLSAAARECGISQPTMSAYLGGVESEAGCRLFSRSGNRLYPTAAGRLYLTTAQEIVSLIERTKNTIATLDMPAESELRVGVSGYWSAQALAEVYPDFRRAFPQTRLIDREEYDGDLRRMLREKEVDLIVTPCAGPAPAGLKFYPFWKEEALLAVPEYLAQSVSTSQVEELPYVNLLDFRNRVFVMPGEDSVLHDATKILFDKAGICPETTSSSANLRIQESMIRSGQGIGLLLTYHVRKDSGLSFFRLRPTVYLLHGFAILNDHTFTEEERYLIALMLKHAALDGGKEILWNDLFREILWEYDPVTASLLNLEEPK